MRAPPVRLSFKPGYAKLAVYFNLDNGGGKIRGIYTQENAEVVPIFEAWLAPFRDTGATTVTMKKTGGTDHQTFDGVGLPGFQFLQDELDYMTRTHHSNMDVYERVPKGRPRCRLRRSWPPSPGRRPSGTRCSPASRWCPSRPPSRKRTR